MGKINDKITTSSLHVGLVLKHRSSPWRWLGTCYNVLPLARYAQPWHTTVESLEQHTCLAHRLARDVPTALTLLDVWQLFLCLLCNAARLCCFYQIHNGTGTCKLFIQMTRCGQAYCISFYPQQRSQYTPQHTTTPTHHPPSTSRTQTPRTQPKHTTHPNTPLGL